MLAALYTTRNPALGTSTLAALIVLLSVATGCDRLQGSGPAGGDDGPIRFDLTEEMRIDGYAMQLVPIDTVIRVAVDRNGRIAIAQRQEHRVRFFSPEGEPIASIGARGQGPGEFENVWRLGWIADTLYAYDFTLRRFTLIDPELRYVRYVHVPVGGRPGPDLADRLPAFSTVFGGALYADGSVYGELGGPQTREIGDYDPAKTTYGRIAEDGTILSYFQFSSGAGQPIQVQMDQGVAMLSANVFPGPERPILRLSDDGRRMAHLLVSMEGPDAGTYEIRMEDVFEGELYRRRYPFDPQPIGQVERDSIIEARAAGMPPALATPFRRNATFPPMHPPVVGMVAGRDGTLWIRMRDTAHGRPYRILDPAGEPLGSLVLPLNARIAVADRQNVWVIERDELDVESLVRYGVVELRQ